MTETSPDAEPCVGHHPDTPKKATRGLLCPGHAQRLRLHFVALPKIAVWLDLNTEPARNPAEHVSGSREAPVPVRLDVLDLIGPTSRKDVREDRTAVFPLWDGPVLLDVFTSWQQAQTARTAAMRSTGLTEDIIDLATTTHDRTELRDRDYDITAVELARTRWQIRPTTSNGHDQLGRPNILAVLRAWTFLIHEQRPHHPWPASLHDVPTLSDWHASQLDWIREQPWVPHLLNDLFELESAAMTVAPWTEETIRDRQAICAGCGLLALVIHVGHGTVKCEKRLGGCGRSRPLSEYELRALLPKTRRVS